MTREVFDNLKMGDRVDGRKRGDGTVVSTEHGLRVQWDSDSSQTFVLPSMHVVFPIWQASPMATWFLINPASI